MNKSNLLILILALHCISCSPIFVINGAYQQAKILYRSQPIGELLEQKPDQQQSANKLQLSQEEMSKLALVPLVREFCYEIGLDPKDTYKSFSRLDDDQVAWVVSASPADSFAIYTWWFPIVGSLPYKGYFDKEDAEAEVSYLHKQGLETWLRPTAAFSTLGWFEDPLLSSTLQLEPVDLVDTVIHETLHLNFWIPESVALNESLANFVGARAAIDFFKQYKSKLPANYTHLSELAERHYQAQLKLSSATDRLWQDLNQLYQSDIPREEKLVKRQEIFTQHTVEFKKENPNQNFYSALNNAELSQRRLYLRSLTEFAKVFENHKQSWPDFFTYIKNFIDRADEKDQERNFELFFSGSEVFASQKPVTPAPTPALFKES